MRRLELLALSVLAACSSAGGEAEEQYHIVARQGDTGEICNAAKKVAAGYLDDRNEAKYREWQKTAGDYCAMARLTDG